ncbi:MAG: hypothetical protein AAFY57_17960 [Cyanobacteria bacterium J06642_2]
MQQQLAGVANSLSRQAQGATSRRLKLKQQISKARLMQKVTRQMRSRLVHAKRRERQLVSLAKDLKILSQWMSHDVLKLAGPSLEVRQELFDFIVRELQQLEDKQHPNIRKLRKALRNQRDELLAFAGVLDRKLAEIANDFDMSLQAVREVCLLYRKPPTSQAY